jgi:hypothetical protein
MFFTYKLSYKHIIDLDLFKGARPAGILIELRDVNGFGALPSTSEYVEIEGRQNY